MKNLIKLTLGLMLVFGVSCSKSDEVTIQEIQNITIAKSDITDVITIAFDGSEDAIACYLGLDGVYEELQGGVKMPYMITGGKVTINAPKVGQKITVQAVKGTVEDPSTWEVYAEGTVEYTGVSADGEEEGGDDQSTTPAIKGLKIVDGVNSGSKDIKWTCENGDDFLTFVLYINDKEEQRAEDSPMIKDFNILGSKIKAGDVVKVAALDDNGKEVASATVTVK